MASRIRLSFDRVRPEDRQTVEQLLRGAPEIQPFYSQELFERWLAEGAFIKAIDVNGDVVGVIHVRKVADATWLEGIAVRPDIRRKGMGRQLALYAIELSGGSLFRVMASVRNVPSVSLANSLGFREVDRVYFSEGRRASPSEIARELGLTESRLPAGQPEARGYVDQLAWIPLGLYSGKVYSGGGIVVLDTEPPFFLAGDAEGFRRFSREPSPSAEELIVYELARA
ncbi:MAG: GNAT family N-acetyltransferase [Acidilobus sp.]